MPLVQIHCFQTQLDLVQGSSPTASGALFWARVDHRPAGGTGAAEEAPFPK
jgi:hypothetical protein